MVLEPVWARGLFALLSLVLILANVDSAVRVRGVAKVTGSLALLANEVITTMVAAVMLVTPWALGGLHPTREDLTWAILLSFAAGFLSIGAVVISAFDIARLDARFPSSDDGAGPSTRPPDLRQWREGVTVAYLDEPPFAISGPPPSRPSGCDMDVADHVLRSAGATTIRYMETTFPELIPGLLDGRWHMTIGIFITDDRAGVIDFSRPIWAAADGFIVRRADAARFTSYEAIAGTAGATLAVVSDQVQSQTARRAGIPPERILEFPDQDTAAAAVREGRVDASVSTAIGNQAYVNRVNDPELTAVTDQPTAQRLPLPLGAFALSKNTPTSPVRSTTSSVTTSEAQTTLR